MNDGRKPINKPLFEIITTAFAHLTNEQIKIIKSKKDEFIYKFIDLQKTNQRFWNSITTGTAVKENVILRNNTFRDFLNQLI